MTRDGHRASALSEQALPLYFFHVSDGTSVPDEIGTELADVAAARAAAVDMSGQILKDGSTAESWDGVPWRLEVTDSPRPGGHSFFVLHFSATKR
ncbi:DUF6894 family protein [Bradyrhizobium sp. CB1015]|uniref:DUF6894 family protein n=1 Tax=Bradyrhizobium sp. CB1015 TaxID=2976822 RepID=UPI003905A0EB